MNEKKNLTIKETFALAVQNHKKNNLQVAEKLYKEILNRNPDHVNAYNNLGIILLQSGKLQKAKSCYKKAIELKPDYVKAYNNLGVILQELSRFDEAIASYKKAIELKPDYVDAHNNLGNTLKKLGRFDETIASYKKAIELKPDYVKAHYNLGVILQELSRFDEAIASYKKAIEFKPDYVEAKHLLAALTGETTNSAPRAYVEKLFDEYASKFERSMFDKLEYKSPKKIVDMIVRNNPDGSLGSILDLGCGTGLIGMKVKEFCTNLEGIDLSNSMLEISRNKNVYDKLTQRDIVDYLLKEELDFDYFISADVFIYVGDLSDVFRLIKSRNRSRGRLVFSTEHTDMDGFVLEKSGRYSHSKKYIESLCKKFDYKLSHFEKFDLRKETNNFLTGGLYLLDF